MQQVLDRYWLREKGTVVVICIDTSSILTPGEISHPRNEERHYRLIVLRDSNRDIDYRSIVVNIHDRVRQTVLVLESDERISVNERVCV